MSPGHRFASGQRAVLVTALSGPVARFGRSGSAALQLWAGTAGVALELIDAYPSVAAAVVTAEASRPAILFGPYGVGPAAAAARASVGVVWDHGGATARLGRPAYPRVVNLPSPARTYLAAVLDALVADGLRAGSEIVVLHGESGFGREVAGGTAMAAQRLGVVVHPVSFPLGQGPATVVHHAFLARRAAAAVASVVPANDGEDHGPRHTHRSTFSTSSAMTSRRYRQARSARRSARATDPSGSSRAPTIRSARLSSFGS